jgi:SCY1-like protein 1
MENPSMGLHAGLSTTTQATAAQSGGGNGLVGTAAGAAGALAGWALSSLNKQIPPSEMRSNLSYTPGQLRNSAGPSGHGSGSSETISVPSTFSSPRPSFGDTDRTTTTTSGRPLAPKQSSVNGNRAGGMQLGSSSRAKPRVQDSSTLVNSLVAEIEDEFGSVGDAWGDGDLMDVNADADDWSERPPSFPAPSRLTTFC